MERASPSIRGALASFLDERSAAQALPPDTQDVIELLCSYLDGYAYQSLTEDEHRFWEDEYEADEELGAFTQLFGPGKVAEHLPMFLSWFLVRKVIADDDFLRQAAAVTGQLAAWLGERGDVSAESAVGLVEQAGEAEYVLPRAERLGALLHAAIPGEPPARVMEERDLMGDMCVITRIEPGRVWVTSETGEQIGPIRVGEEASRLAQLGWEVSALHVARLPRRGWAIFEVGNVYPL